MTEVSSSLHGKMARGAAWMVLLNVVERALGLISMVVLARVLAPTDFGVVAMAGTLISMAQMLSAFGFDVALIQNQRATESHYHTAWTLNLLLGLLILLLMWALAGPIATYFNQPEVFWVVCVLAFGPLIGGCENIGVVAFRKDLHFQKEFSFQISRKLIGFAVTIPLALWFRSYWALVTGMLAARLAGTITSYLVHPFRPHLSLHHAASLFGFSRWLLLNNIVGYLKERTSDFVIGRQIGAAGLGVYNISYEVALMPSSELSAPINRALLPGFASMVSDPDTMRKAYLDAMGVLMLVAVPAAAGIYVVAPYLVPVVLGPKWLASVPLMEILALNGGLLVLHSSICTVLISSGHPDQVTKANGLYVVILLMMFGLLVPHFGLSGAAFAALGTSILSTPFYLFQVRRLVGVPIYGFLRALARPLVAALVMSGLVRWIVPEWSPVMNMATSIGWLTVEIALGIAIYSGTVALLWLAARRPVGAERVILKRAQQRFLRGAIRPASTRS
ncbi:MAG: lipopolysaccharide biosynthesis protein [Sterolibacteriaceae bacterium]|uniref:Lipopolysaccharide biosynthesis protein n=1 Tax=Candidatus Methylophosphatis roskildensis TaxID=2899263 RepID=A0A9D7HQT1_9PROT|nr:lipopolysaccharide biosynthesis protein [Candidatus Methylophosphatis roskildensis]MBK7235735.1 lipopolysaccharide biosynthesis protein [Sterolibacteriaceae bacterium]